MNRLFTHKSTPASLIRGLLLFSIMMLTATGIKATEQTGTGWTFNEGTLTITTDPGTTAWIDEHLSSASIITLIIGNDVTTLAENVFEGCEYLENVTIGTGVKTIGIEAFQGCTNLATVTFNEGLTTIGANVFYECTSLTTINFPESLTDLDYTTIHNSSLTTITVTEDGTFKAIDNVLFKKSTSSQEYDLLYVCPQSKEGNYTIPEGVTAINKYAFLGNPKLTSITIPASVTQIGYQAFGSCPQLTTATFLGTETTGIDSGCFGYYWNDALAIYVPEDAVEAYKTALPDQVNQITTKPIEGEGWSIKSGILTISSSDGMTNWVQSGLSLHKAKVKGISLEAAVTSIQASAFAECSNLTEVTIPADVTTIGNSAFSGCTSLATVTFKSETAPALGTAVFNGCTALTAIYVPEGKVDAYKTALANAGDGVADKVQDKGWSYEITSGTGGDPKTITLTITSDKGMTAWREGFASAGNIIDITVINIGNEVTTIPDEAIQKCGSLKTVTIGENVGAIGARAFKGCAKLESIIIPAGVTIIKEEAFWECTGLTSITLTEGLRTIEKNIFVNCTNLKTIQFPKSLTDLNTEAITNSYLETITVATGGTFTAKDNVLFKGETLHVCSQNKEGAYTIPDGVTAIGSYAFSNCYKLTAVTIPESVATIETYAFYISSGIKTLTFLGTDPGKIDQFFWTDEDTYLTIYVPEEAVEAYKKALWWLAGKIQTISASGTDWSIKGGTLAITSQNGIADWVANGLGKYKASVTSLSLAAAVTSIPASAFTGCSNLAEVTIPATVTTIGDNAFANCTSLAKATFLKEAAPALGTTVFEGCTDLKIYIPTGATGYTGDEVSENWKALAKYIVLEVTDKGEITVPKDGTVTGDSGTTADKITPQGNATFEDVKTDKTEIPASTNSTITLTGSNNSLGAITIKEGGSLTLTAEGNTVIEVASVQCAGSFTDQTGTVTEVKDVNGSSTLLAITPPALSQEIPYNSSSLTLTLSSTEGATSKLQKLAGDTWEDVGAPVTQQSAGLRSTSALRSTAAVTISEAGTYRVIVTKAKDGSVSTTLFTKPFTVTKGAPPYIPPVTNYFTVTLPEVEGATLSKATGGHTVEEGYSLTFTITLDADYSESVPVVTTDRGETIEPDGSGRYRIRNVEEDIVVSITGIVKNIPTAIESVESGTKVWAANGTILVRTAAPQRMQVFSLAGSTVISRDIPAGDTQVEGLTAGLYIVRLSDGTIRKVAIRK